MESKNKTALHENHRSRVRKKYLENGGLSGFADHEIIEFLMFYSVPRKDTNELAHKMINEYENVLNLLNADPYDIMRRCKVGEGSAIIINMIPQLARWYNKLQSKIIEQKDLLDSSRKIGEYAKSLLIGRRNEHFYCVCLDVKRRVIGTKLISEGSVSHADVSPRQIAECAIKFNASGVILAHNHPSTDCFPSGSDKDITVTIKQTLQMLDVEVIDHVIVGGERYFSFAEHKLIFGIGEY
jgi:DNA repair protein RadC